MTGVQTCALPISARQSADAIADPDERAWSLVALAQALAAAGDDAAAQQTFTDVRQTAAAIADPFWRAEALCALAQALAAAQQWTEARQTAETIADPFWRAAALRAVAVTLINVGQIDNAAALLMRSWAQAQSSDELTRLFAVDASLLRTYPTLGSDLPEAFNWVERVVRAG